MRSVLSASARLSGLLVVVILLVSAQPDGEAATPVRKPTARPVAGTVRKAPARPGVKPVAHAPAKPIAKTPVKAPVKPAAATDPNAFIKAYEIAKQAFNNGNFSAAEPAVKKSLQLAEKANGPHRDKNIAVIAHLAGMNAFRLEKYDESSTYLKRALAIYSLPENSVASEKDIVSESLVLGQIAMYLGQYQQAEHYYRTALPLAEKQLGLNDEHILEVRHVLADIENIGYGPDYLAEMGGKVIHWADPLNQPIRVYVGDGSSVPGWKPEDRALVQDAYAEWQQALGNQIRFEFTEEPQDADTIIGWMEKPKTADPKEAAQEDGKGPTDAKQEMRSGECQTEMLGGMLTRDDIVLALNNEAGKVFSANSLHNVALHEIGHSLGLIGGHSNNPSDVLFPNSRYYGGLRKRLSQRDINTVKRLYTLKADVSSPGGIHLTRYRQFTLARREGFEAFNSKNYALAYERLKNATGIYDQDSDVRFFTGDAAYLLKRYDEAVPYFLVVSSMPGKLQAEALKMAGYAVIKSAQDDEQTGNRPKAEQKYAYAQRLLFGKVNSMPMEAETNKAIRDQLNWLNQRLAMRAAPVIQWASASEAVPSGNSEEPPKPKKKKKWLRFFDPVPASGQQIIAPGGVLGY